VRLRLIWVGKTKNAHVAALVDDYVRRLARFSRMEVTELREGTSADERALVEEEGKRIAATLTSGSLTVLLDVEGQQFSSHELAAQIEAWQNAGTKEVAFIIGGHLGVNEKIKRRAQLRWSLSRLTLTHELARVFVVEQLYRAHTILRGLPYQK
jgi:23S rRNA (pseudouridine1915-N3)-methyltransferase